MINKLLFLIFAMLYSYSSNAGVMPIPIIIPSNTGVIPEKEFLGLLIVINIIGFSIIILRSLIWLLVKPNYSYIEYVWFNPFMELILPNFNLIILLLVNSIAVIIFLSRWVSTFL